MKYKYIVSVLILIILGVSLFTLNIGNNTNKIKVAEVAHSVFYAPQYVAHALGYFEDEGIEVEFILTPGADKVSAALLSGDVQIGFAGSETSIYVYNNGQNDFLVNIGNLTKRDGSFIVSRTNDENFNINDLEGKTIIGGRTGGMPAMTLEMILNNNDLFNNDNVFIDTSIDFQAMSGAFISGIGDYVTLFEPAALALEKEGFGYVVASLGELGGEVPYTTYQVQKSYLSENEDDIKSFLSAINKGLDYVHNNNSEEIASVILPYFPDTSLNDLISIVERYKNIDSWYESTFIEEEAFNYVQDIIENSAELTNRVPYNILVDNSFYEK